MRQSLLGEEIESERHPRRIADAARSIAQRAQMMVGILSRRGLEQLRGKPEYALRLVRDHELQDQWLEISKHLDLRERFFFYWVHSRPLTGISETRNGKIMQSRGRAVHRRQVGACSGPASHPHTSAKREEIHIVQSTSAGFPSPGNCGLTLAHQNLRFHAAPARNSHRQIGVSPLPASLITRKLRQEMDNGRRG